MTVNDARKCALLLAKLFPAQLTKEQQQHAIEEFRAWELADVEKVIRHHRSAFQAIDWPALFEACRTANNKSEDKSLREGSWADVFRRQCPHLKDASDPEVVLRVHRGWWHKGRRTEADRRGLENSCVNLLIRFGFDADGARRWAETVFEESPEFFRQCLEELRTAAAQPAQSTFA